MAGGARGTVSIYRVGVCVCGKGAARPRGSCAGKGRAGVSAEREQRGERVGL